MVVVSIFYNIIIHYITNLTFLDLPFYEKNMKSANMLLLGGIIGLVISHLVLNKKKKYNGVSKGFVVGGLLLLITSVLSSWNKISDDLAFWLLLLSFSGLIWHFNK